MCSCVWTHMTRRNVPNYFCCYIIYTKDQGVPCHLRHYTSEIPRWGDVRDFQVYCADKALWKLVGFDIYYLDKIILLLFCYWVASIILEALVLKSEEKKKSALYSNLSPLASLWGCSSHCFPHCQYPDQDVNQIPQYLLLYSYYIPQNKYQFLKWRVWI